LQNLQKKHTFVSKTEYIMAKDIFHENVREALLKEGWKITSDLLRIDLDETYVEIDLAAEMVFAAEREGEKIAVEVKSFLSRSIMSDFHTAIGQYLDYFDALEESEPERELFLALPIDAYNHRVFQGRFIQKRLKKENVKLIVFDPLNNTITEWRR
jgi:XisH protein